MSIFQSNFREPRPVGRPTPVDTRAAILADLSRKGIERIYRPNGLVLEEGAPLTSIKLLRTGWVSSEVQLMNGSRLIIDVFLANDLLQLPTIAGAYRTSARALDTVTVVEFPLPLLTAQLERHGAADILAAGARRAEAIHIEHIVRLGRLSAMARLAHFMLELGYRIHRRDPVGEVRFHCPLKQTDLADALGMTPIHVNRTLRKIRALGLMTVERKTVLIPDWQRLGRLAEFNSAYLQAWPAEVPAPATASSHATPPSILSLSSQMT